MSENFYSKVNKEDYIHFILLDENVIDAKNKLSMIYPNIAMLEFDNSTTKTLLGEFSLDLKEEKSIKEHFQDFYRKTMGEGINLKKEKIVTRIINKEVD